MSYRFSLWFLLVAVSLAGIGALRRGDNAGENDRALARARVTDPASSRAFSSVVEARRETAAEADHDAHTPEAPAPRLPALGWGRQPPAAPETTGEAPARHARSATPPAHGSGPRPTPARRAAAPITFRTIDPTQPGNSFAESGVRVAVEGQQQGGEAAALDITLSLDAEAADQETTEAAAPRISSHNPYRRGGFTREEELFRAKWGWAAFDRVQRELKGFSNAPPSP